VYIVYIRADQKPRRVESASFVAAVTAGQAIINNRIILHNSRAHNATYRYKSS